MKIAFVHPRFRDYRLDLFDELNEKYDTTFIFTQDLPDNILKVPSKWNYKNIGDCKAVSRGYSSSTTIRLVRELLTSDYTIIVTSTRYRPCFLLAKLTGKSLIFWTEYWYWDSDSFIKRLRNFFSNFMARHTDALIATGTQSYEFNLSIGASKKKMFTYPQCSVDYSTVFNNKDLRKELHLKNKKIILFLSRIIPSKGLDYLINAFALLEGKMDDVCLLVVGDGYFRKECEDLVKKSGVENVFFMGSVDMGDKMTKANYYRTCDVFVLPTVFLDVDYERWGLVINEAMAFGKPIVTTDSTGAAIDMVKDGYNGYVVENGNIQELYGKLYKILNNSKLAEEMGKNSRKIFEEKNVYRKMAKTFIDAIEHVKKESKQ